MSEKETRSVAVFPDLATLSHEAADRFMQSAKAAVASRGRFFTAIAGGSTPRLLYELLGSDRLCQAVDWEKTHLFWSDERMVPPDHPESSFKLAFDTFISRLALSSGNIHRIRGENDAETSADEYERELLRCFGNEGLPVFDLIILGVGEDGHTASLFPGSPALAEGNRLAVPVHREKPSRDRVTLTLPVLNNASHVLFLASGRNKAAVLHDILEKGNRKKLPAGLVKPARGDVRWFIDKEAAEKLCTAEVVWFPSSSSFFS